MTMAVKADLLHHVSLYWVSAAACAHHANPLRDFALET